MSDQPSDSIRYFNLKYRLNYNYEVIEEGKEEPELFSTRGQIVKQYGISLSSIRHVMKGLHSNGRKKWSHLKIKKCSTPIPLLTELPAGFPANAVVH